MKTLLTVELVPRSCWYRNVRSEIPQKEWDRIRRIVYCRANHRCEICNDTGRMEAHEIWKYDDSKKTQTLVGFVSLCQQCHEVKHFGLAQMKGRDQQAINHLCKVNQWTKTQAREHINKAFEIWGKRSEHEWQMNTNNLEMLLKENG